jgi:septal ring factor EnvC (AmiA/AmiB activator)
VPDESSALSREIADMVKTLERAIAEVERLPSDMQERIGRDLLARVEKLQRLRADLAKGVRSLKEGRGRELDIEDVIKRARRRNAKA